ncbi:MAG: hypothetical protein UY76_C0003G0002 [Candidatus Uhrbacteria bacterium GW2011_GWA2_52_8d]|uniref:Uncharacterized protein n=1 Tax=Candidatus Uhrbacteria bacterium GW2011_GWA2_52_8d TaxID=1618979 RepID=A0A0G1ZY77_9BACT|nr:MAG: hypothetical protein UY76_C0003G0002 [Candidatus Uhrbacteria bacterium GW2011_GWA2_52_8d]
MDSRRTLLVFLLCVGVSLGVGVPPFASAQEYACSCYCATKQGAILTPNATTDSTCRDTCESAGNSVATCARDASGLPSQNVSCFTKKQCANQEGKFDSYQPSECLPSVHYCYPDPSKAMKVTLSTSIAGLTVTGDLGEYISKVYQWMLGAATTIAIVFLMVAGLRWTLGGLSAEEIGKAKKTIQNSVIGLVLLLFTYLILSTVNPQLLKLQVPTFPMIRTVLLVGEDDSCEYLLGKYRGKPYLIMHGAPSDSPFAVGQPQPQGGNPYIIKESTASKGGSCGSIAEIDQDWEGNDVADGETCQFTYCGDEDQKCIGVGATAGCVSCDQVASSTVASSPTGVVPSESTCAELAPQHRYSGNVNNLMVANYCNYMETITATGVLSRCISMSIECLTVSTCDKYSLTQITGWSSLLYADFDPATTLSGMTLERLCTEDPCKAGERSNTSCVYSETTGCGAK